MIFLKDIKCIRISIFREKFVIFDLFKVLDCSIYDVIDYLFLTVV